MMMNDKAPRIRRDLEFIPVQQGDRQFILIRDHLGLVQEGKGVALHLYQFMSLLDGTPTTRDLQMVLMRQKGGVLVGSDEVQSLLAKLDAAYMLDSDRFKRARDQIVAEFSSIKVRPCSLCGRSYPADASELKIRLDDILASQPSAPEPEAKIKALVAPHIDPSAGYKVYAGAYRMMAYTTPSRVVVLGTGHRVADKLFCLTDKDFETPLGIVKNEPALIQELRESGGDAISENDFAHRSEHAIEFQIIFLQHLLPKNSFTILPILCGSFQSNLPEYQRKAYQDKAGSFLQKLRQIIQGTDTDNETLIVAGVDFSHTGPKFGHEIPAAYMENQSTAHDKNLLNFLARADADRFWEESIRVEDRFNVCGFPALACLLEVLPGCEGKILDYQIRHETATQSAVSFAAAVLTSQE